jgi:hypothetical protein
MITKNILYKYFKDFADNHLQIKDYGYGDLSEISSSTATTYPLFWVSPQPSSISGNEITYNFNILIGDRLEDGDANKVEVESDTFQIGLDLLATLNLNRDVDLDKSNTLTPFIHDFKDRIAGHLITVSVTADFDYNECAVPTTGTPTPPTSSCPVAIITINGVAYGSAASGGTEDIAVVDGFGTPVGSLVSGNWVVTASCPNASAVLKNTLGTTLSTTSIASGGSSDITAPDSTITINSASFSPYPSGSTSNILVKDGSGNQVGSKVGTEWIVPSTAYDVGTVDRFGNTLLTNSVSANTTLNWQTYDYADFFLSKETDWSTSGYTDAQARTAITNLVDGLITDGIWDKLYCFFPFVGGTAAKHKWNLKNPTTFEQDILYFVGSPTHNELGVVMNGSSNVAYINANPRQFKTGYEFNFGCYSQGGTSTANTVDIGYYAALNSGIHLSIKYSTSNHRCGIFSAQAVAYSGADTSFFIVNRLGSAYKSIRNTTNLISVSTTADGQPALPNTLPLTLGAAINSGLSGYTLHAARTYSGYWFGQGLTDTQLGNFNTRVQAFNLALNRQQL